MTSDSLLIDLTASIYNRIFFVTLAFAGLCMFRGSEPIPNIQVATPLCCQGEQKLSVKARGQKRKQNAKVMMNYTLLNVKVQWDFHNFVTSQLPSHIAAKQNKM